MSTSPVHQAAWWQVLPRNSFWVIMGDIFKGDSMLFIPQNLSVFVSIDLFDKMPIL